MTDDEMGQGEMRRGFERLERQLNTMQAEFSARYDTLAEKMTTTLELKYRLDDHQKDLDEIGGKVRLVEHALKSIELRAAAVSGGIVAVGFFVKFLLGK